VLCRLTGGACAAQQQRAAPRAAAAAAGARSARLRPAAALGPPPSQDQDQGAELLQVAPGAVRQLALRAAPLDLPPGAQQYGALQPLQYNATARAPKVVQKQLHPGWVASRGARPLLQALFRPADYQVQFASTGTVEVTAASSPRDIVRQMMADVL
jgi:hypothetical protein